MQSDFSFFAMFYNNCLILTIFFKQILLIISAAIQYMLSETSIVKTINKLYSLFNLLFLLGYNKILGKIQ